MVGLRRQAFPAPRQMPSRQAVLLTPPKSSCSGERLSYNHTPLTTPVECAVTSLSQIVENTATLSPAKCALTRMSPARPLEYALAKNTRGWVAYSSSHTSFMPNAFRFPCSCLRAFLHSCSSPKPFRSNTYTISHKCSFQRTYRNANFFKCNTYKKQGGTSSKPKVFLWRSPNQNYLRQSGRGTKMQALSSPWRF
jgi:hypothetical protein